MKGLTELLLAVQNGDEAAFADLLKTYDPLIEAQARIFSKTCPEMDAEDLKQEASLAFYKAAKTYRTEEVDKVTFGLYAKTCIRNRLTSVYRKHKTKLKREQKEKEAKMEASFKFTPEECIAILSKNKATPLESRVFTLFYAEERSYSEIALELQISVKSVDNALYRIKKKIRSQNNQAES
ncbi:MAG: sigma-70 family RNA polymerase sigma factor [Clostridia bacterium]|nr:sigma-70 family RNA polymerase sigma factor [Clostridia bacterium]